MLKTVIFTLLAAISCQAARTTVTDTLYQANGALFNGQITVTWPTFTGSDGNQVLAGRINVSVSKGVFTVALEPTTVSTPPFSAGIYYTINYSLGNGLATMEYWNVPASMTPVGLNVVRVNPPPGGPSLIIGLSQLASGGATTGQILSWSGINWVPANPNITPGITLAPTFNFPPQTPGGSLTANMPATITMAPCPRGVNGIDPTHSLYVSGGAGTPEAVLITGGTCTSGSTTGTVIFTPANSHSGAWTIAPASGGLQEAICAMPSAGGQVAASANIALQANVNACGKTAVLVQKQEGIAITGAFTVLANTPKTLAVENYDVGPNFSTLTSNWAGLWHNVNGFSPLALFGGGTVGLPEAIRGSINIPSTSTLGNHAAGVAGYASTGSGTQGAVGIYGEAIATSTPSSGVTSVFGANFLITNCAAPWTACAGTNMGTNNYIGYGEEIDFGINKTTGGATPTHLLRGIYLVNAGEVNATGFAIDLDNPVSPHPSIQTFLHDSDGTASVFADIGTLATGNNTGSQPLHFRSRDTGGVNRTALIGTDAAGDLLILPGSGADVSLGNSVAAPALKVQDSMGSTTTPFVAIAHQLQLALYTYAQVVGLTPNGAGAVVFCTDCVTAGTCAAGGAGHTAIYNGLGWACN